MNVCSRFPTSSIMFFLLYVHATKCPLLAVALVRPYEQVKYSDHYFSMPVSDLKSYVCTISMRHSYSS